MTLETGDRLGRYEILGPLGAGGMGEVYRARDSELEREVAIKVLPDAVSQNPDRLARFKREAKSLAALNHPNITTVFSFESAEPRPPVIPSERRPAGPERVEESGRGEGPHPDPSTSASLRDASAQDDTGARAAPVGEVNFLVMELLEGETLRERLDTGALGWRKATEIGAAIAEGLAAAHRAGIVHRDLKPSNIFITSDDRVKILDFGLARSLEIEVADQSASPTQSYLTDPGSVFGTVGYMSPEQVRAQPADHRADIFSLGCVLYEMVCGRRAFLRDTAAETMTAILKEEPADLHSRSGDLSPVLADVVGRCLEKRPEARFQSAHDLAFALRSALREGSGPVKPAPPAEKSIVVLPFDNLSPDPDQEYFADGLTEEVISDLAKVRALRVVSRTSAMQLKGTDKDLRTIGRELDVRYVLEGSVRRAGDALRITAQLIDAESDAHLWADKYTGTVDDIFDFQEQVSRSIVGALEVQLSPGEDDRIKEKPAADIAVYELVLRARRGFESLSDSGILRAIGDLENGLKAVGDDADLLYHLGYGYLHCRDFGVTVEGGAIRKAEEYARAYMRCEPDTSRGHFLLGRIEKFRGNAIEGLRHLERAYSLDPGDPDTMLWLAVAYSCHAGRPGVAVRISQRLLTIDPLWNMSYFMMGLAHWFDGNLDEAIRFLERSAAMEPEDTLSLWWISYILMWKGEYERAFEIADQINQMKKDFEGLSAWNAELVSFARYAMENKCDQAAAALSDFSRDFLWNDPELPGIIASLFVVINHKEEAYRWLGHAIDRGSINYRFFAEDDPFLEDIRGEKRFQKFMDQIKPKWESFEVGIDLSGLPPANGID